MIKSTLKAELLKEVGNFNKRTVLHKKEYISIPICTKCSNIKFKIFLLEDGEIDIKCTKCKTINILIPGKRLKKLGCF